MPQVRFTEPSVQLPLPTTTPNPDRHIDGSRTISVRVSNLVYNRLHLLIANSPRPHGTVGGYVKWLIETQALRRR